MPLTASFRFAQRSLAAPSLIALALFALASCAPPSQASTAASKTATAEPWPAAITQQIATDFGCAGAVGASMILDPGTITKADLGGPNPVYVVDSRKARCSIPTNVPDADSASVQFWTGPANAPTLNDSFLTALIWKADKATVTGITDPQSCDDAVFDAKGDYAPGACTFQTKWDAATSAVKTSFRWDPNSKAPSPSPAIEIPAPFAQAVVKTGNCKDFSGTTEVARPGFVTSTDINGDGVADTILDYTHLRCTVGGPALCGTGGCPMQIWIADTKGGFQKRYDDQVLGWRVVAAKNTVELMMHGSHCGLGGADACVTRLSWDSAKGKFAAVSTPEEYAATAAPASK